MAGKKKLELLIEKGTPSEIDNYFATKAEIDNAEISKIVDKQTSIINQKIESAWSSSDRNLEVNKCLRKHIPPKKFVNGVEQDNDDYRSLKKLVEVGEDIKYRSYRKDNPSILHRFKRIKLVEPILDHKGNIVAIVDDKYDLRDYDSDDLHLIIEKHILNESHRGSNVLLLPVGWSLVHTDTYNKNTKPSWWIGTPYEKPIVYIKIFAVVVLFFSIPYAALTLMENIPDDWRIEAKNKQSSSGGG
jgi:hypothetical protein